MSAAIAAQPTAAVVVEGLEIRLTSGPTIVEDVTFRIQPGQVLALVGESGSGKTTTAQALLGAVRSGAVISAGSIMVAGQPVHTLRGPALRRFRGKFATYVPQNPGTALDPSMRIGKQVEEMLEYHVPEEQDKVGMVRRYLELALLPANDEFLRRFPHQLSGGQQQRVLIAMALICRPAVIVMDEPTTGLDVTTQAHVLETINSLRKEFEFSLLYVTHNLGVVSRFADEVAVMYGGRIVEHATCAQIFRLPAHPYTRKLIAAMPRTDIARFQPHGIPGTAVVPATRPKGCPFAPRCEFSTDECTTAFPHREEIAGDHVVYCYHWRGAVQQPLPMRERTPGTLGTNPRLAVENLEVSYGRTCVLHGLSCQVHPGEILAVVGESGSGKSTLARCIMGLLPPSSGRILLDGNELAATARRRSKDERRKAQIVFQNPDSSLNPRLTVREIVGRPVQLFFGPSRRELRKAVDEALSLVRLDSTLAGRKPADLSGGEKQRVAIARAIATKPELMVCDEITSALDVSVQAAVVELIDDLRKTLQMSVIFVSHDLAVVRGLADQVLVLEHGVVQELGDADAIFEHTQAEYTGALLQAHRAWSLETLDLKPEPSTIGKEP